MKLTYWVAPTIGDSSAYNIRAKTKKEAAAKAAEMNAQGCRYGSPVKVEVEYADALDLVQQAMGEGGIYEG